MQTTPDTPPSLERIVILGGGTAGWMTATALSRSLGNTCTIILVESDQIGTVGVGEATIPEITKFNKAIGLDENEFLAATGGTFKLGIDFVDWKCLGEKYMHPFGFLGTAMGSVSFADYWLKAKSRGWVNSLEPFSLASVASTHNKFMRPVKIENSPLSEIAYAFHFDAHLYAKYLRKRAEAQGVTRIEGKVINTLLDATTGNITCLQLESGLQVEGDFFVDCSGLRAELISKVLGVPFEDWSEDLPCNNAVTVGSPRLNPLPPYTRATAKAAGWQWRIPLQHRTGNGYVYCDRYISHQAAEDELVQSLGGSHIGQPKRIAFTTGRRKKSWEKNCVAIGLSSGFLEPLESTSIHLVQEAVSQFIALLPSKNIEPSLRDTFNKILENSYINIRDFLVLHYWANARQDSPFWVDRRNAPLTERLQHKIQLFQEAGVTFRENQELFGERSWFSVMHGQGLIAKRYHSIVDEMSEQDLKTDLQNIAAVIETSVAHMPLHEDYVERFCKYVGEM